MNGVWLLRKGAHSLPECCKQSCPQKQCRVEREVERSAVAFWTLRDVKKTLPPSPLSPFLPWQGKQGKNILPQSDILVLPIGERDRYSGDGQECFDFRIQKALKIALTLSNLCLCTLRVSFLSVFLFEHTYIYPCPKHIVSWLGFGVFRCWDGKDLLNRLCSIWTAAYILVYFSVWNANRASYSSWDIIPFPCVSCSSAYISNYIGKNICSSSSFH